MTLIEVPSRLGWGNSKLNMLHGILDDVVASGSDNAVWVSTAGDDTAEGSILNPVATVKAALALASLTRPTVYVLSGEYEEASMITWPTVNYVNLVGIGPVSISNGGTGTAVIKVAPGAAATSSFGVTIQNVNLAADAAQIGLEVANAAMTKKLNLYLTDVSAEMGATGDSVDIAGTVSGQAIRAYVKGCEFEGLVHATFNDAGSRLRCSDSSFVGGITTAGAVAAELSLRNCKVLTSGLTIGSANWDLTYVGCVYATDADPAVYSEFVNSYSA